MKDSDSLFLGDPGHLTATDTNLIQQHFAAILRILDHAGMDNVHVLQFLYSLVNNWWLDLMS